MNVAVYCRVSTSEQTTENQRIRLTEYCDRMGWVYEVVEETESSRGTRPKKQVLLARLRKREFDTLLVWKLDRWARSSIELLSELEELQGKGVSFISYSDNIDSTTAAGKLQFSIIAAFAEFERNLIRERTLEGLNRARKQGKILGRPKGRKDSKERPKHGYYVGWDKRKAKTQ